MTELMKRYEAETGDSFLQAMEFNKVSYYMACYKAWLEREYHILEAENAQLKDKLRWRPVSEKPEKSDYYIARFRFYGDNFISVGMLEYCTNRGWIPDVEVVEWFDIPPALEGK